MGCEIECFPQELGDTILKHQLMKSEEFFATKEVDFLSISNCRQGVDHPSTTQPCEDRIEIQDFSASGHLAKMFVGCEKLMIPSDFLRHFCSVNIDIKSLSPWCDIA